MILEVCNIHKSFAPRAGEVLSVVNDVSFKLAAGASCALVGPSGSGKTTLLGLCAGLDLPTEGSVRFFDTELTSLSEDQRAVLRRNQMGFVFQNFQLIPNLSALENVTLPLELAGVPFSVATLKASAILDRVGLSARLRHYPQQLSGGEQQRVALARAVVHNPVILFADEPTGNLDAENGAKITELLFSLNSESKTALVLVTHNPELAKRTDQILQLKGGRLVA